MNHSADLLKFYRQCGDTLLEVMVALLIFSAGLVGLASLQLSTIQQGRETTAYNSGLQLAADLAEQIQANPEALAMGWYANPASADPVCDPGDNCGLLAFTATGLAYWKSALNRRLLKAKSHICRDATLNDGTPESPQCDGLGNYTIKLWWSDLDGTRHSYQLGVGIS
jgi:type IV pilus assembly protein PilV